jgi:hypothetical protein
VKACSHIDGISEHCGHALTWRVLTTDNNKVINCSVLRPADSNDCNIFAELLSGEDANTASVINSRQNDDTILTSDQTTTPTADHLSTAPIIDAEDLIGRKFLLGKREDGQGF